jgi:hypothetical protein
VIIGCVFQNPLVLVINLSGDVGEVVGDTVGEVVGDTDGDTVGEVVGDTDGDTVGEVVGDTVGEVVGDTVGEVVGDTVGEVVGDKDGDTVGEVVGDTVGEVVGDTVGEVVGDTDGDTVGEVVGDKDGDTVGEVVGDKDGDTVGEVVSHALHEGPTLQLFAQKGPPFPIPIVTPVPRIDVSPPTSIVSGLHCPATRPFPGHLITVVYWIPNDPGTTLHDGSFTSNVHDPPLNDADISAFCTQLDKLGNTISK